MAQPSPSDTSSGLAASLASLSLTQADDDSSTAAASICASPKQSTAAVSTPISTSSATKPSAVHQFNTIIREIKQLKKHHCIIHHNNSSTAQQHEATAQPSDAACHCHKLLDKYQQALSLASIIRTASSTATRQQLVDRIAQLNNQLLPPLQPIDSHYTLHRRHNHYILNIPHPTRHYHMPAHTYQQLYDYQRESLHWLCQLHAKDMGGILGDDMGLGKTVQVSALLSVLFYSQLVHHVLLIVPTSLIDNWKAELSKWCPTLPLHLYTETPERRAKRLHHCLHSGGILLSTYGVLSSLQHTPFDALILDEGHRIKNADTQQTRQVKAIECGYRVLCTGTVVQNRLTELWCLMDFVCCGRVLGDRREFKEQWSDVIEEGKHKGASVESRRLSDELSRKLSELIRPYIMRRTKEEIKARHAKQQHEQQQQQLAAAAAGGSVPLALPSSSSPELRVQKNELVVWLYPSEAQRRLYTALLSSGSEVMKHAQNAFNLKRRPLDAMSLLRTLCSHPRLVRTDHKLCVGLPRDVFVKQVADVAEKAELVVAESEKMRMLLLLLDEHRRHGHRTLVFSWSVQMLDLVSLALRHHNIPYLRIDGQVPPAKRTTIIEAFRQPACPASVFLLSTGVGGVGLNLTSADRCVILDPDWNPATDAQSIDRCYRIGQTRNVVVYRFVTVGTIEEIVYRKQVFKQSLTRLVQGGSELVEQRVWMEGEEEGGGGAQFTREELRGMFKQQDYRNSQTQRQLAAMYPPHLRHSYPELDEHIELLQRLAIFGLTDHDLLSDHAANANRSAPPRTQHEVDELDDPKRKERVVGAAKRAKQRAEDMTRRLQQYVPQPPAWPSLSRRKREDGTDEYEDHAEGEEEKELDWRERERRKEREEEKTAEWTDVDEEAQRDARRYNDNQASDEDSKEQESIHDRREEAGEDEVDLPHQTRPHAPREREADGDQQAEENDEGEDDEGRAVESEVLSIHSAGRYGDIADDQSGEAPVNPQQRHDDEEQQQADEEDNHAEPDSGAQEDGQAIHGSEDEQQPQRVEDEPQKVQRVGETDDGEVEEAQPRVARMHNNVDDAQKEKEVRDDQEEQSEEGEEENEGKDNGVLHHVNTIDMEEDGEEDPSAEEQAEDNESSYDDVPSDTATDSIREQQPTSQIDDDSEVEEDEADEEDEDNQYQVEAILDKRRMDGRIEYKVRWKGYGLEDDSWRTEHNLDCEELVEEYEARRRAVVEDEGGEASELGEEDGEWVVEEEAVEAEGDEEDEETEGEEERVGGEAADADSILGREQYGESEESSDERDDSSPSTDDELLPTSTAAHRNADDEQKEDEDDSEVDAPAACGSKVQATVEGQTDAALEYEHDASESEAVVDCEDERIEWDEAVEWAAADNNTMPSTPATATSVSVVSATPVRLHVHASVTLSMGGCEPLSHEQLWPHSSVLPAGPSLSSAPSASLSLKSHRYQPLVCNAMQLIHTALQLPSPPPTDSTCACILRNHIHRLSHLTVHEMEEALDLLTQALQLSLTGCDSVMEVAVVLMERLEQAFDETRRQERVPGAGVRRWLCV